MNPLHRLAVASRRSHPWRNTLTASLLLVASIANATEYPSGDLTFEENVPLGKQTRLTTFLDTVEYSNVSFFLGQGYIQGGSALQGSNTITQLLMDDITPLGASPGEDVTQLKFSIANFNATPVTVRPRIRFWFDDTGLPGLYYNLPGGPVGFSFNPITINVGVTILTATIAPDLFAMPSGRFWAGVTFDDNNGTTGITQAQLDQLGQGFFDPPLVGSSEDLLFETSAAGSFFGVDNPPGAPFNFGGNPIANVAWEFTAVTSTPTVKSSWGRIKGLYR